MISRYPCLSKLNGSVYSETLHNIEVIGYRYVILTICIFGIACNILNLCVLFQPRLKESPYTYLAGLAMADMLTLISISPFSLVRGDYIRHENIFFTLTRFEMQFYMPLANYFGQVSIMIILALTIERYLFTTYPLRAHSFCKPRYARITIAVILFICAVLSFPRFIIENVKPVTKSKESFDPSICSTQPFIIQSSSTNFTHIGQCFCVIGYSRKSFLSYRNAYYITMFILNQILPVIILLFLNIKLIKRVRQSNRYTINELAARQHNHTTSSSIPMIHSLKKQRLRDEHRLTKTLVAIVLVFLICNTFTIISYPVFIKQITSKRYPNYMFAGFRIQKLITNIMLLLNYSVNFFFYCAFNRKFLDTLKTIFRRQLYCYFHENLPHQNSTAIRLRTLFNSTTSSSTNSSYRLQSTFLNPRKNFPNHDKEFQRLKHSNQDNSV